MSSNNTAILVTHYNRPDALARSLPQIVALGAPVLVVDDGSTGINYFRARTIAANDAEFLPLPRNRGLAAALNIGLSYLLADPQIEWVSYLQDDVDVNPDLLTRLAEHQHPAKAPLLTGHDAAEHPGLDANGTKLKQNARATHLHAHRDYWLSVMPIPTRLLGAPCPIERMPVELQEHHRMHGETRGYGSMVDFWICRDAPTSIVKRGGGHVVCVPGLVRTFLWRGEDSSWGNTQRAGEDAPLA